MGARSGGSGSGGGASFGSGASLPDKDMGVVINGNPLRTAILNSKLQTKNAKGLIFKAGPGIYWVAGAKNYGIYVEGEGWMKFKNSKTPFMPNRKSTANLVQKSGLLDYSGVEFVKPVKSFKE